MTLKELMVLVNTLIEFQTRLAELSRQELNGGNIYKVQEEVEETNREIDSLRKKIKELEETKILEIRDEKI